MERIWIHPNKALARHCWLMAGGVAAACMLLTFLLYQPTFLNNDDTNILYALAGYRTGTPYPTHRFINAALGLLISFLYRVAPGFPWWAGYQLAMLWLSLTVINGCVLKLGVRYGVSLGWLLGGLFLLYCTTFIYAVIWVTFTLTACLLGAASAALILTCGGEQDTPGQRRSAVIGALLLLTLCFLTRNSAGYSMLCFVLAALFYRFLLEKGKGRLRAVVLTGGVLALSAVLVVTNSLGVSMLNPAGYGAFEEARGRFIDYPHVTYGEDPAFFEAIGWDETVYDLADNLCYLDGSINADTMNRVSDAPYGVSRSLARKLSDTLAYGIVYFRGSGVSQYMLAVPLVLLLWCVLRYVRRRGNQPALLVALLTAAGAFILCFYLCYTGRFPVRTFMLICMPTVVLETLLLLCQGDQGDVNQDSRKRTPMRSLVAGGAAAATALLLLWSVVMTQRTLVAYDKTEIIATNAAAEGYATNHPKNVYLTDVTSLVNIALFTVYPEAAQRPVNLVDWGGTGMYSGWKEQQLTENDISDFTGALFRRENVYFITEKDGEKLGILLAYLTTHENAVDYELVEPITGNIAVYRFLFEGEAVS